MQEKDMEHYARDGHGTLLGCSNGQPSASLTIHTSVTVLVNFQ